MAREVRCDHGCLRSQVTCEKCDAAQARAAATLSKHAVVEVSDSDIIEAVRELRSASKARNKLGLSAYQFQVRERRNPELRALVDTLPRIGARRGGHHPAFKDETGKTIASALVVSRSANDKRGNACWNIRLACGHERVITAIELRSRERDGQRVLCPECPALSRSRRAS